MHKFYLIIVIILSLCFLDCYAQSSNPSDNDATTTDYANIENTISLNSNIHIMRCGNYYIIDYCPPENIHISDTTLYIEEDSAVFCIVKIENANNVQYLEDNGYPELPFYSIDLLAPNSSYTYSITAIAIEDCLSEPVWSSSYVSNNLDYNSDFSLPYYEEYYNTDYLYAPAQQCKEINTYCDLQINPDYYFSNNSTWNDSHNIYSSSTHDIFEIRNLHFNVYPIQYNVTNNSILCLRPTRFYIKFEDFDELAVLHTEFSTNYKNYNLLFDTYSEDERQQSFNPNKGDYLIITQDAYNNNTDLLEFIEHKTNCGYNMHIECVSDYTSDSLARIEEIKQLIETYYQSYKIKYVLLIGDEQAIPPSQGKILPYFSFYSASEQYFDQQENNPPTDAYYECFDCTEDKQLFPKVIVGRWLIYDNSLYSSTHPTEWNLNTQLHNIVRKTINEEFAQHYSVAFIFTGTDTSLYMRKLFKHDGEKIKDFLNDNYLYSVWLSIGENFTTPSTTHMTSVLQIDDGLFSIYRGHGDVNSNGDPYNVYPLYADLQNTYVPFSFAFSCLMGSYNCYSYSVNSLNYSKSYGNSVVYSSSSLSYSTPNRNLSRTLFEFHKKHATQVLTIGELLSLAEQKYFQGKKSLHKSQREIKKYNILGDPSLYIYGLSPETYQPYTSNLSSEFSHPIEKRKQDIDKDNYVIYDILGNMIYLGSNVEDIKNILSVGTYIIANIIDGTASKELFVKY